MPLFFWGDEGNARYRSSYFERFPDVWTHGDRVVFHEDGTCLVLGRSDATLNRFGVRIGSAEIYRTVDSFEGVKDSLIVCVEDGQGGYFMPLFLELAEGVALTDEMIGAIRRTLRKDRSPRHVPDVILQAPEIPLTLTGKKMEVPVRKLLLGAAMEDVASEGATRNPHALRWFAEYAVDWRQTQAREQERA
jgi:acetoacetyl-CoA synthetase